MRLVGGVWSGVTSVSLQGVIQKRNLKTFREPLPPVKVCVCVYVCVFVLHN